jgi:hypothetical protein
MSIRIQQTDKLRQRRRACCALLALAATATAATAGTSARGDGAVGGSVLPTMALSIGNPTAAEIDRGRAYQLRVPVQVTTTDGTVRLSIADGENFSGPAHGRVRDNGSLLSAPLTAAAGAQGSQSLSAPLDPLLKSWAGPVVLSPATVVVTQQLQGQTPVKALQKTLLITVSDETP